jgi:hypothetical protein
MYKRPLKQGLRQNYCFIIIKIKYNKRPLKQGFIYFVGADSNICPFSCSTKQGEHGSSPLRGIKNVGFKILGSYFYVKIY